MLPSICQGEFIVFNQLLIYFKHLPMATNKNVNNGKIFKLNLVKSYIFVFVECQVYIFVNLKSDSLFKIPFKRLGSVRFVMFLKEVLCYVFDKKKTVKIQISWNIIAL